MNIEQKVENLEGEIGLMKGEIKKTLVDLRDFILKQGSPFGGGGEGGGGGLSEAMFQNMLEEAKASIRLETVDGGGGGMSLEEVRLIVEDAMMSRPSDGGGVDVDEMRREMEDLRRENQRAIDAVKAEASSSGGGASRQELEAIKAEVQSAGSGGDISRAELEALRAEQATQASATQRQLAAMQNEQASQSRTIQQAAAPIPQIIQAPAQPQVVQAGQAEQQAASQRVQMPSTVPTPVSQPEAAESIEIQPPAEGEVKKPPPQVIQIKQAAPQAQQPDLAEAEPALPSQPEPADEALEYIEEAGTVYQAPAGVAQPDFSPAAEDGPEANALDANLLTSLMRWVGGVKRRLGSSQLEGFLEIYKLTGHLPPVVERLIYYLAELEALPDESSDQVFTLDDLMDSLLHLHAIVYGPGHAARVSLPIFEEMFAEDAVEDG